MNWLEFLGGMAELYRFRRLPPAPESDIEATVSLLRMSNIDLESFYRSTNGIFANWFIVLPIETQMDRKRTWDGIKRANDRARFSTDTALEMLFERFLIFSRIGGGKSAVIDRLDSSIWYEEDGLLRQTNLSLAEYIEVCLKEAVNL